MFAGTLARLGEPADERLESALGDGIPAFDVRATQTSFDNRPIQRGLAATKIEVERPEAQIIQGTDDNDDPLLHVEREPRLETVSTEWVADVTGSGLVAAESVTGSDMFAFPFDMVAAMTDRTPLRLGIDVTKMHDAWRSDDDGLADAWMTGADEDDDATSIQYHDAADVETEPTFGLGFVRPWNNTVQRGVAYASGYVAVYNAGTAESFMRFLTDAVEPYTFAVDDTQQIEL